MENTLYVAPEHDDTVPVFSGLAAMLKKDTDE